MAKRLAFVLGPSGVGKSTLGRWLAEDLEFLHLEHDIWPAPGDGIDALGLRAPWSAFYERGDAGLAALLADKAHAAGRTGTVLTFASSILLPRAVLMRAEQLGIASVILYGSAAACISAFLRRERTTGRNLPVDHWLGNNRDCYLWSSLPELERWREYAFVEDAPRSRPALVNAVRRRLA